MRLSIYKFCALSRLKDESIIVLMKPVQNHEDKSLPII